MAFSRKRPIDAQLTIVCSINRKLGSGDYKQITVCCAQVEFRTQTKVKKIVLKQQEIIKISDFKTVSNFDIGKF